MYTRRVPIALFTMTAVGSLLAGCSSSETQSTESSVGTSPLSPYLSSVWGGDLSAEERQTQFSDQNRRTEELVADCMQDQGFEYIPNVQNGVFVDDSGEIWDPDDRGWVEQWGYGAVNVPGRSDQDEVNVDPNADYIASLSASELDAFYDALNGPALTEAELAAREDGFAEYDWRTAGCYGAAQHRASEVNQLSDSAEFKALFDAIDDLQQNSSSAPEMVDLNTDWSECMARSGFDGFVEQHDAEDSIYDAVYELYGAKTTIDGGSAEPDQVVMRELGAREVEIALADLDCREETDYRARQTEIQNQLEQQFVNDHRGELQALRAAAEQD